MRYVTYFSALFINKDIAVIDSRGVNLTVFVRNIIVAIYEQEPGLILVYFEFLVDKPVRVDADITPVVPKIQTL